MLCGSVNDDKDEGSDMLSTDSFPTILSLQLAESAVQLLSCALCASGASAQF